MAATTSIPCLDFYPSDSLFRIMQEAIKWPETMAELPKEKGISSHLIGICLQYLSPPEQLIPTRVLSVGASCFPARFPVKVLTRDQISIKKEGFNCTQILHFNQPDAIVIIPEHLRVDEISIIARNIIICPKGSIRAFNVTFNTQKSAIVMNIKAEQIDLKIGGQLVVGNLSSGKVKAVSQKDLTVYSHSNILAGSDLQDQEPDVGEVRSDTEIATMLLDNREKFLELFREIGFETCLPCVSLPAIRS